MPDGYIFVSAQEALLHLFFGGQAVSDLVLTLELPGPLTAAVQLRLVHLQFLLVIKPLSTNAKANAAPVADGPGLVSGLGSPCPLNPACPAEAEQPSPSPAAAPPAPDNRSLASLDAFDVSDLLE